MGYQQEPVQLQVSDRLGSDMEQNVRGPVGKDAGANSMVRELSEVFGIAILVAVFAGTGSYASAEAFSDGFAPAIGISAALSLLGAIAGMGPPGRPQHTGAATEPPQLVPALEAEGRG